MVDIKIKKHFIFTFFFISACTNIGPNTVPRDRFDYNTAISNSWKEQTLLNIAKLRYGGISYSRSIRKFTLGT